MKRNNGTMKHKDYDSALPEPDQDQENTEQLRHTVATAADLARRSLFHWGVDLSPNRLSKPLSERYRVRQAFQQQRYQENLERIVRHGLKLCADHTADQALDLDWLHYFIDLAQTISQPAMQSLWSRIFALESMHPGSFSLKALDSLKGLTQREAKLFQRLCELASRTPGEANSHKLVIGYQRNVGWRDMFIRRHQNAIKLGNYGLPYSALLVMMDSHLLHRSEMTSAEIAAEQSYVLGQGQQTILLKAKYPQCRLRYYRFTPLGEELSQLLPKAMDDNYRQAINHCLTEAFSITEGEAQAL